MDEQIEESVSIPLTPTLPAWWRVLPSLIILMMIVTCDSLILNDFIENRYTTLYQANSSLKENARDICLNETNTPHNAPTLLSTTTSKIPISTTLSPHDLVQSATARLNIFISICATIPSILTSILLGSNCDRIGRKPLITLPYLGKIIRYFILSATAYYNLSDLWIVLAIFFDGACGTSGLSILSSFSYVSDCTTKKTRTKAIIIIDVCIVCSKVLPLITLGIYLKNPNFIQTMIFVLLVSVAGFVFSIVLQPESNLTLQHLNVLQQLAKTRLRPVTKMFHVFLAKRLGHNQRSLLILVCTHLGAVTMSLGGSAVHYLYLYGAPFCMDTFGASLTSIAQSVAMILYTVLFTLLVGKRSDHLFLPIFGCLAHIGYLVIYGIADKVWMIYLAYCVGGAYNVLMPIVRSRITKLVEPDEYARVFILTMLFETGGSYAINALANEIYRETLTFYAGIVFFAFSLFGILAILLMTILYILEFRSPVVENTFRLND